MHEKILIVLSVLFSSVAMAETGIVIIRNVNESNLQQIVIQINNGCHRGYFHDSCNGRRKVYAVEVKGGGYRVNRYGQLERTGAKAIIKYSCNGGRD